MATDGRPPGPGRARHTVYNRTAAKGAAWVPNTAAPPRRHRARPRPAPMSSLPVSATTTTCATSRWAPTAPLLHGRRRGVRRSHHGLGRDRAPALPGSARARLHFVDARRLRRPGWCGERRAHGDVRRRRRALRRRQAAGDVLRQGRHTRAAPAAAGQLAKMVNQVAIAGLVQALAEALAFGKRAGWTCRWCWTSSARARRRAGRWTTAARHARGQVRLRLRRRLDAQGPRPGARRSAPQRAQLPVTALVDQFYAEIQAQGGRRWDTSSLLRRLRV